MKDEHLKSTIKNKVAEAKKKMANKGRNYDGLGDAIDKTKHQGPDLGPRTDIEYRKLIKEIRTSGDHDGKK